MEDTMSTVIERVAFGKPVINEHRVRLRLIGMTPLLMHNPVGTMSAGVAVKSRRIPSPEEEAEANLYASDDGKLYVKFAAIRACALSGAKSLKVGKMSAAKFLASCMLNLDLNEPCWLYHPETGKPLTKSDYVIDLQRVVVQRQSIIRARPKIMEWATDVEFILDTTTITRPEELDKILLDALTRGGQICGIGDYRPERGGPFGRFWVELITSPNGRK
jgi:hypothetical protein